MSLSTTQSWSSLNLLIALHWLENEDVLFGQLHMSLTMWPCLTLILSLCLVSDLHSNQIHLHPPDWGQAALAFFVLGLMNGLPSLQHLAGGYTAFQVTSSWYGPPRVCAPAVTLKHFSHSTHTRVSHAQVYIFPSWRAKLCLTPLGALVLSSGRVHSRPFLCACWMNKGNKQKETVEGI